jgi:hypothetical protein
MPRGRKLTKSLAAARATPAAAPTRPPISLRSRRRTAPAAASSIQAQRRAQRGCPGRPDLDPHRRLESASRSRFSLPMHRGHGSPANELKSLANLIENCAILQNSAAPPFGDFGMAKKFCTPRTPALGRSSLLQLPRRLRTRRRSARAESSPPGWAWCRGRIQPAGKPGWAASPSAATVICAGCSSTGQAPICCDRRRPKPIHG